jgi:hypothetical protein
LTERFTRSVERTMTMAEADNEAKAFLGLARTLRDGETDREKIIRPFRRRYDRSQNDLRMPPDKRAKIAAEFVRAALYAEHIFTERIEEGQEESGESSSGARKATY